MGVRILWGFLNGWMDCRYQRKEELTPATWIPVARWDSPFILVSWRPLRILPKSVVRVTRTSGPFPPIVIRPTEDSGFALVLAEKMRLTASDCASKRVGLGGSGGRYVSFGGGGGGTQGGSWMG